MAETRYEERKDISYLRRSPELVPDSKEDNDTGSEHGEERPETREVARLKLRAQSI